MSINRGGGSALNRGALWLEEWMHRAVASPRARSLLELGAGGLNHVRFEPGADTYDVVEPLDDVFVDGQSRVNRTVNLVGGYSDLIRLAPSSVPVYDKVVSVAVLEHLEDLPSVVAASALLMRPSGTFAAGIPSEGGKLWEASWRATTGRAFRRRFNLDYSILMGWEHINSAREIQMVLNDLFEEVVVHRFPGPTLNTSVYTAFHARNARLERARSILESKPLVP